MAVKGSTTYPCPSQYCELFLIDKVFSMTNPEIIAAIIAVVVVLLFALWKANKVSFSLTKESMKLSANKNGVKDSVQANENQESQIDIKSREGLIVTTDKNEKSNIKIS
jgi:FtsZ-interacting cell division protein ZipA